MYPPTLSISKNSPRDALHLNRKPIASLSVWLPARANLIVRWGGPGHFPRPSLIRFEIESHWPGSDKKAELIRRFRFVQPVKDMFMIHVMHSQ